MLTSACGVPAAAAVIPGGGTAAPCYEYTNRITTTLSISNGEVSCRTTVYGISGTTTKIVVNQYLEKKNGSSWDKVKSWTDTFNSWWCNDVNTYTLTESGTYRLRSVATVYCGSKSEDVDITSVEKTVKI